MMARLGVLLCLLATVVCGHSQLGRAKYTVLAIEYVGHFSDKSIPPIVISDSKKGAKWCLSEVLKKDPLVLSYVDVVQTSTLEKLIAETESHKGVVRAKEATDSGFVVAVTIIKPEQDTTLSFDGEAAITLLYDGQEALSLLDSLQKRCEGDRSLHSELEYLSDHVRLVLKSSSQPVWPPASDQNK